MLLKSTGNLSAIAGTIFATLACMASAETEKKCPEEAGFTLYSALSLNNSTVCISSNEEVAKLSIVIKSSNLKIENKSLIDASEISEAVVHLEQSDNKANLYFEHPQQRILDHHRRKQWQTGGVHSFH